MGVPVGVDTHATKETPVTANAPHEAPDGVPEGGDRNGPTEATASEDRASLLARLDGARVEGALAHERDCLSFMLSSWPWPEGWDAEGFFTMEDMAAQLRDLRAVDLDGALTDVADRIARHVAASGPTRQ